jgi:hypothetical protein
LAKGFLKPTPPLLTAIIRVINDGTDQPDSFPYALRMVSILGFRKDALGDLSEPFKGENMGFDMVNFITLCGNLIFPSY